MAAKAPVGMPRCDQQHPHSTEHHWQLPFAPAPPRRDGKGAQVGRSCCQGPWAACSSLHAGGNLDALRWSGLGKRPQLNCCWGELGSSNTGTHKTRWDRCCRTAGLQESNGKERDQPGAPASLSKGRVCLGFCISLNHPPKKSITALSDSHKRRSRGNSH